jgi:hypothetical protein
LKNGEYDEEEIVVYLDDIILRANRVYEASASEINLFLGLRYLNLMIVIILGYIVWRFFPTYYWRLWLRLKGNWIIK